MRTKFELEIKKHKGMYCIIPKNKILRFFNIVPSEQPCFGMKTKEEAEYFLNKLRNETEGYFNI